MFMEVEKVKVTDHYLKRSKERMNLCAKKAERVANLAYWRGYRAKDCKKACDIRFLESKSGADTTQNISHLSKVKEAYKDLLNKFSGKKDNEKEPNDPWWNAFNHAKASGSSQDIKDLLKDLSDKYVKEIYPDIKDYNIIPCGTVFIVSEKEPDDFNDVRIIKNQIEEYFKDKEYKNLIVICSTQKSYNSFLDYLGVPYEK